MNVVMMDVGKGSMVFAKSVKSSVQQPVMANDHEANSSTSTSKYSQVSTKVVSSGVDRRCGDGVISNFSYSSTLQM